MRELSEPPTIILQLLPCSQLFVALFYLLLARPSLAPFSEMEAGGRQLSIYEMGTCSVTRVEENSLLRLDLHLRRSRHRRLHHHCFIDQSAALQCDTSAR